MQVGGLCDIAHMYFREDLADAKYRFSFYGAFARIENPNKPVQEHIISNSQIDGLLRRKLLLSGKVMKGVYRNGGFHVPVTFVRSRWRVSFILFNFELEDLCLRLYKEGDSK